MSAYPPLAPQGGVLGRPSPTGWDATTIGGYTLPGHVRPRGARLELKYDPKPSAGKSGASPTAHGIQPQPFELEWVVWSEADLATAHSICQALLPPLGARVSSLAVRQIDSPWLRAIGIRMCLVLGGTQWEAAHEYGVAGRKMSLRLLHVMQQVKKTATNTPKISSAPAVQGRTAQTVAANNPTPSTTPGTSGPPR
jgi:hypothetical protein